MQTKVFGIVPGKTDVTMNENENCLPLVSIVIPCYNHENYVKESIQSVIGQDYENIELIIIDDGSTDKSIEKIKELLVTCQQRFVRFEFRYRPNMGLCATLNEALEWSMGEFFAPIASDDILLPHKTSLQVREYLKMGRDDIAAVFGDVRVFSKNANHDYHIPERAPQRLFDFVSIFLRQARLLAPTALIKTDGLRSVGGYNKNLKIEDFYLWLKLTEKSSLMLYIGAPLVLYRRHAGNTSKQSDIMLESVLDILARYSGYDRYPEAVARSYLVHAADLIECHSLYSVKYLLAGLLKSPKLIFSKLFLLYFYRAVRGLYIEN